MERWDPFAIVLRLILWTSIAMLVVVAAADAGQCETIVIQRGHRLWTCVICTSDWGQTTVRCF